MLFCTHLLEQIKITNILGQAEKICSIEDSSIISLIKWSIILCDIVGSQRQFAEEMLMA